MTDPIGLRVFVYRNLRLGCYSVRAESGPQRGRVIAHAASVEIEDALLRVSAAGRARVLRERSKNVHAGVLGTCVGVDHCPDKLDVKLRYDPYRWSSFVRADDETAVLAAMRIVLRPDGVTGTDVG